MFCYKCGAKLDDEAKFCRYCGAKLNVSTVNTNPKEDSMDYEVMDKLEKKDMEQLDGKKKSHKNIVLVIAVVVVLVLVAFLSSTLGGNHSKSTNIDSNITENDESTSSQENEEGATTQETEATPNEPVNIVLMDADDIYVEFRGIEEYSSQSWIVNLYVENNRDSEIYVSLRDCQINKFSVEFANNGISIPANGKYLAAPNFDLIIDLDDLAAYGINTIETLDFNLRISTEMFGDVISETPVNLEIKKVITTVNGNNTEVQSSDVLLNSDNIYVEFRGIEEYSSKSWIVNLYVENNRDSEIYVSLRDGQVNKFSMGFSNNGISIPAGSKYLAAPNFDLIINIDDLNDYGITNIETLDFTLRISTEMFGDLISETPVSLEVNKPLS